ncbi:histidine triad nucleotide-binding protein [Brachybacterium huguangmaarense]|uniref:Histidine triad nucleotide-binding protein n=1 Tax=Brachybacterium huguangmaarense TaxID=1652028 RepID=A0ABY6FZ04_9MICO|nr:histidine triad nucleotide-binding protein [Brachybacterium huguangmaarense]UYG16173.1 histidine triad nucleotide-binding protein [Brachybacterium huguangmaarense]
MTDPVSRPDPDCVFCGIVAGDIPSDQVFADDRVVAFRDLAPKAPVHVLVVPREHSRDVRELAGNPVLLAHVVQVAGLVARDQADGDFRLVFNTGARAGQTVMHAHAHVLAGADQNESDTGAL